MGDEKVGVSCMWGMPNTLMVDPRFARLKTDPRFRKPRRKSHKVVVDDRFKSIFDDGGQKFKGKTKSATVDKYGRKRSLTHDSDNLKRFYRLEKEEELTHEPALPDYARGEFLMESSDEGDEEAHGTDEDDGEVILGRYIHNPIKVSPDESEIDLDESQFAELDALAEVNATEDNDGDISQTQARGERTNRLAVVNLDWDHVRASHLLKIFSSIVSASPSAPREREKGVTRVISGKVLKVQIYPSEFGKARLEKERTEGPPKELFKRSEIHGDGGDDELPLVEEDDGNEYDEDALRNYQLERLRYYYAIATCDTVETAFHIFSELDETELERSANVFDLSFVPNEMVFDEAEVSDEATQELFENYKGVEFVTDALRHSKVKLTWDDDDPERHKITRRTLSRKEIEESDFKAYLASSGSSDEGSNVDTSAAVKRDKMRSLLLGGDEENELLPEGWGKNVDKAGEMEITFTPGLSGGHDGVGAEEETTLQRYLRKQKERRKQKKTAKVEEVKDEKVTSQNDEFFGEDDEDEDEGRKMPPLAADRKKGKLRAKESDTSKVKHAESTPAELELLLTSVEPSQEPKHFDMRSVIRAEKLGSKKRGNKNRKNKGTRADEDEAQEHFTIDVKDDRFKALHEDHAFAIDPTNPHFKKTKSMTALLEERARRQRNGAKAEEHSSGQQRGGESESASLKSLVESVKRKSSVLEKGGKRRKL